ncbi:MAG: HAD-IA family hydrolase [Blastocatellia bacterium]|nr:HAD-IA family hydrolase [Blastocatellia bacterium]
MKADKRVIIFDMMDTVVVDPFLRLFPEILGMSIEEILKVKDPNSWPEFELGLIGEEEYFNRFYRPESGRVFTEAKRLKEVLFSSYRYIEKIEELLLELKESGQRLWIHSNYSVWFSEVRARLGFDRFFEGYILSYDIGVRKPDREAYQKALSIIGERAESSIFIDDRLVNVEAACKIGMQGIVFEETEKLRQKLASLSVI